MISTIKSKYLLLVFVFSFLVFFGAFNKADAMVDSSGNIFCAKESYWKLNKTGAVTGNGDEGSGYFTLVPLHPSSDTSYDTISPFTAGATLTYYRRWVGNDPISPSAWDSSWTTEICTTGPLDGNKCSVGVSGGFYLNPTYSGGGQPFDIYGEPACIEGGSAGTAFSPPNRISATFNVTATAGTGGTVSSPCVVASGNTSATCSNVVASGGYTINPQEVTFIPSGCAVAGSFSGSTYTTGQVSANCNANFTFNQTGTVNGFHDGASGTVASTSCNARGWAALSTQPGTDLTIGILSDGVPVYYGPAGEYRSDLTGQCTGGTCAFNVDLSTRITSGVNHSITVQAQNPSTSAWTTIGGSPKTLNCTAAPVAPATPTGLTATAGACGTGTIAVSWTASSGATSYTLRDGASVIYTGAATSFNHTGLVAGSSHSYTVLATNASGSSAYSSAVSRTAPALCAGMSGTLTASNCTIASGASSCNSSLSWSTTNPIGTSAVTTPTNITVGNGNSGSTTYVRTPPGNRNFYLYNNSQLLSTATSTAACASGTAWDGSKCSAASVNGVCAATHYNCTAGTSANNTEGFNWTWNCNGSGGGTNASCTELIPPPTNFVSACNGAGTTANFSWTLPAGYTLSYFRIKDNVTGANLPSYFIPEGVADTGPSTSMPTTPGHDYTAWVHTRLPSGAYSNAAWSSFTCVSSPTPDLTATNPNPTTATVGVPQIFSSTITNGGTGSTGAGFTNLFQTSPSSTGASGVVDYPVSGMATLVAGASAGTSKSITFSSPGIMYIRACADKSSAADVNGTISESSELNNCSISNPWTAVTVTNPTPPSTEAPEVTIWASPTSGTVNLVNPTILWSVANDPTSCTASGDWSGNRAYSGAQSQGVLNQIKTYTYTLTCSNANGSDNASATVVVSGVASGVSISVNPTSIYAGDSAQLTWAGTGSCTGTNFNIASGSPLSVSPATTTTYTITCDGVSSSATLIVKKKPIFIED